MIFREPIIKNLAYGALMYTQTMTFSRFELFQNRVLLSKYVYIVYEMLMLILNEQQFLITF